MAVTDLTTQTDVELDDMYTYMLGQHREATGARRTEWHDAIMLLAAEYARRTDAWLAART